MSPRPIHWVFALSLALAAHWVAARWFERPAPPLVELEPAPMHLTLGGAGAQAGDAASAQESAQESLQGATDADQTVSAPASVPETSLESAPERQEHVPAAPPPPPPVPKPKPKPEPKPEPKPVPPPQPAPRPKPAPPTATPPSRPSPPEPSGPRRPPADTAAPISTPAASPAARAGSGATTSGTTTSGPSRSDSRVDPGAPALQAYLSQVNSLLERHKRYPRRAQQLRQEGEVRVRFVIARSGAILSPRIERGSGQAALDEATLELLRRVSPLPPLPPELDRQQLEIVVPVAYRLR